MLVRMFACGAVLTAALVLSAPLAHAGGHGGHGGGGHGGGGHGSAGHGSGFHSSSFHGSGGHGSGFHSGSIHGSSFHSANNWHGGGVWHGNSFHNGVHSAHFHNGNRVIIVSRGGWGWGGWGWGGWGWGWPGWWNNGSWGGIPSYYVYAPTYSTPVIYPGISGPGETMPYDDAPSSDGTYPYDGGPRVPVPLPRPDPAPKGSKADEPDRTTAARIAARPKYRYPAYGEGALEVAKTKTPASTGKQTVKKSGGK